MYEDAVSFLARVKDEEDSAQRELYDDAKNEALRAKFQGIPEDFLQYLKEIGSGAFRDCQFSVMGDWLCPPSEILGEGVAHVPERLLCFGDNFAGDFSGFLPDENWTIAEIWHSNGYLNRSELSFGEYIRARMLMGPGGEDLRA